MVDPFQLFYDSTSLFAYLVLPFALFGGLFLLAWDRGLSGEALGFGKRTFLLLLVGGVVGSLGNLPFFAWNDSVLMVNVGGGLIPVTLSLVLLDRRLLPGKNLDLLAFVSGLLVSIAATLVLLVRLPSAPSALPTVGFLVGFGLGGGALLLARRHLLPDPAKPGLWDALAAFGLVAVGVWGTYLTTQVLVGTGIVSVFPFYLIAPGIIGVASVAARWPRADAPALAYATSTLGVLIGADILHQPQLFQAPAFLGSIGGAGPMDLVFLSGPFALGVALLLGLALRRGEHPTARPEAEGERTFAFGPLRGSEARFQPGLQAYAEGRYGEVAPLVLKTLERDVSETRAAVGLPPAAPELGLEPLTTHPLLAADLANLRRLSLSRPSGPEDARRALVAGFLVQRGLLEVLGRRLATVGARAKAFGVDLLITSALAIPLLYLVLLWGNLDLISALTSIAYLGAISALGAWPFAVYAAMEWAWGVTPGKHLMGITVVGPDGGSPTLLASLARNGPKLLPLFVLSLGLGLGVAYAATTAPLSLGLLLGISVIALALGGVAVLGVVSLVVLVSNRRRQRLGDILAGTMVWNRVPPWAAFVVASASPTYPTASLPVSPLPSSAASSVPLPGAAPSPALPTGA